MKKRLIPLWMMSIMLIFCASIVSAEGLSITMKRTNPGIAGLKPAEVIFDIVNTDMQKKIDGFIYCRSPDELTISSTLGMTSGSGAQYVSPLFSMDEAPSQKAIYLTVESNYPGDYNTNCVLKYIPYTEVNGKKLYQKLNLAETETPLDSDYREIRLDKTVPVVTRGATNRMVYCPQGMPTCTTQYIVFDQMSGSSNSVIKYLTGLFLGLNILLLILILKRTQR